MSNICSKLEKCPIYMGILKDKVITSKAYRRFYCESDNHVNCKRYLVSEAVGKCPPNLLPNYTRSVDEIISKIS